jgi:hypothetical protein
MKEKGSERTPKTNCCDQKGCCPSPTDSTEQQPPSKKKWWKIAVFALGMLMVIGAIAYSLTTRNSAASSGPLDNVPSIGSYTSLNIPRADSYTSLNIPNATGIGDLKWSESLAAKFADHDFIFMIFPDSDINSTKTLSKRVSDASAKIEARGARVETITLSPDDPEFSITMKRLRIGQVPTVLAISVSGNGAIMTGDITEENLLQTYLTVLQPVCVTGGSSGCCGGGSSSGCGGQ